MANKEFPVIEIEEDHDANEWIARQIADRAPWFAVHCRREVDGRAAQGHMIYIAHEEQLITLQQHPEYQVKSVGLV